MEKRVKERYSKAILQEAMWRYGIAPDRIRLLDGFESFMYEFERDADEYILRIAHSLRRNEPLIQAEADWINYLSEGGASVPRAILSENGRLVEALDDGQDGQFLATAFVRARGRPPWEVGWSPTLYERYGQLLGRLHALTRGYRVADPARQRPQWDDDIMLDPLPKLPATEAAVLEKFQALLAYLRSLPRDSQAYGLIHFDAHGGNLFIDDEGTITLFDFDDCCYSWFVTDIAIVLFYIAMWEPDVPAFTQEFMTHFLRGYRRENHLDPGWLLEIPYFLKLREIDLYAVIHRSFDVDKLDDPWCERYMRGRKERIENDVPYIDFDFALLAPHL